MSRLRIYVERHFSVSSGRIPTFHDVYSACSSLRLLTKTAVWKHVGNIPEVLKENWLKLNDIVMGRNWMKIRDVVDLIAQIDHDMDLVENLSHNIKRCLSFFPPVDRHIVSTCFDTTHPEHFLHKKKLLRDYYLRRIKKNTKGRRAITFAHTKTLFDELADRFRYNSTHSKNSFKKRFKKLISY